MTSQQFCDLLRRSEVITLSPADSASKYNIHKGLLQHKCNALYIAYTSTSPQNGQGYKLDTVPEDILKCFVHWLYTGNYSLDPATPQDPSEQDGELDENEKLLIHARIAVFAQTYLIDDLKRLAERARWRLLVHAHRQQ